MRVLLALIAALALSVSACGDDGNGQGGDTGDAVADGGNDAGQEDVDDTPDGDDEPDGDDDPDADDEPDGDDDPDADDDPDGDDDPDEDAGPPDLSIDNVSPSRGPVEGGTQFVITGEGFTRDTAVYFGSREAIEVELVDGDLVGQTPEGAGTGSVNVKLLDSETGEDVLSGGFTYTTNIEVTSVSPERVPTEGDVEVRVQGSGFDEDTRVSFGGETGLRHQLVDDDQMRVLAPPNDAGAVDVRATNLDGSAVLDDGLTYFDTLEIEQVRPAAGSPDGGETVTVEGTGFEDDMTVEFGSAEATLQSVQNAGTEAEVVTPPGTEGLVDVRLETTDGDATIATDAFYYAEGDDFALAAVEPEVGPSSGGIDVTLLGAGLDDSGLTVEFGGEEATVTEQGFGHATADLPAHATGAVDVSVTDGDGNADSLEQGFEYVDDIWLDRVDPAEGDAAGGQTVTLEGEGFEGAERVRFGGISADFTVESDEKIEATVPARSAGTVDVVVERDIEAELVDGFTYTESLDVAGFQPVRGSIAGNTYVEVRGRGFTSEHTVEFGDEEAESVDVLDAQTLAVRTPPQPTGAVDVSVTDGDDSVKADEQYTYFNPGSRHGGAWGGPVQGAVNVTVYDAGGAPVPQAHVQLSTREDTVYKGETNEEGLVTLSGPDVYGEQTVSAVAGGYSSATVQRVDAENITIFLVKSSSDPPPPAEPPPTATIEGEIDGLEKLKVTDSDERLVAFIGTTQSSPWESNPSPGQGSTVYDDGSYSITSRVGDLAVVAVGGVMNTVTEEFEPLAMAVERGIVASDGQTIEADLDLKDHPLDEALDVKVGNSRVGSGSDSPDINRVDLMLDFGFEGTFAGFFDDESSSSSMLRVEHLPDQQDELSDLEFFAVGGSYVEPEEEDDPLRVPPYAEAFLDGITDLDAVTELPTLPGIAEITSPSEGGVPEDGLVTFESDSAVDADIYYLQVTGAFGAIVWEAFTSGDETSYRFPDFPEFSEDDYEEEEQMPAPYPDGTYGLNIFGIRDQGTTIEDFDQMPFTSNALTEWESYSVNSGAISF